MSKETRYICDMCEGFSLEEGYLKEVKLTENPPPAGFDNPTVLAEKQFCASCTECVIHAINNKDRVATKA
jgi:hypothetical protein